MTDTKTDDVAAFLEKIAALEQLQGNAERIDDVMTAAAPEPTEARIRDIVRRAVR